MSVIVVGLEHGAVPLDLLERAAVGQSELPKALGQLRDRPNLSEAVVLSTCLRTEVYAVVERFHEGVDDLQEFLAGVVGCPVDALADQVTVRFDDDVATYLFTVAAGLRSAVLGESEVLGQVRRAWQRSEAEGASGPVLGALFRHAIEAGKRVRSETAIARGVTSLSHGAVALAAERRSGGLAGARVAVVGAGEMGEGVARALGGHGPAAVVVVNRSADRSRALVGGLPAELAGRTRTAPFGQLARVLASVDVVVTSVGAPRPVVDGPMLAAAVAERPDDDPLVVVDLGVPRNVEGVAGMPGRLVLLDMDDLRASVAAAVSGRRGEVDDAARIVDDEVERYRAAQRARDVAPMVSALRSSAEEARRAELERQRGRRGDLTEAQWEEVDAVTRAVMATLLHRPTVALKDAAGTPRGERLVESLRALFGL